MSTPIDINAVETVLECPNQVECTVLCTFNRVVQAPLKGALLDAAPTHRPADARRKTFQYQVVIKGQGSGSAVQYCISGTNTTPPMYADGHLTARACLQSYLMMFDRAHQMLSQAMIHTFNTNGRC
jgi:hypothetical protein